MKTKNKVTFDLSREQSKQLETGEAVVIEPLKKKHFNSCFGRGSGGNNDKKDPLIRFDFSELAGRFH